VSCPECGAKAPPSWSFCRSCKSSLDDARTVGDSLREEISDSAETGCPKCGHDEADVDDILTVGRGLSGKLDVAGQRFQVVSCTRCGYSEFYRGGDTDLLVDLFQM
jgi:predicted nucleic-acid-binding Zn-ribbon protein